MQNCYCLNTFWKSNFWGRSWHNLLSQAHFHTHTHTHTHTQTHIHTHTHKHTHILTHTLTLTLELISGNSLVWLWKERERAGGKGGNKEILMMWTSWSRSCDSYTRTHVLQKGCRLMLLTKKACPDTAPFQNYSCAHRCVCSPKWSNLVCSMPIMFFFCVFGLKWWYLRFWSCLFNNVSVTD